MVRRGIPRGALANAAADNSAVPLDEARVCVGSPEKSLRQSPGFDEETTGSSIKRAQQAGAPASLLKRAQKKRKAQREAQHAASSGEGAAGAAGDDGSPLDLTAELGGAAGSQKKKAKVVNPLAALRPPTREEAMVDGHRRWFVPFVPWAGGGLWGFWFFFLNSPRPAALVVAGGRRESRESRLPPK